MLLPRAWAYFAQYCNIQHWIAGGQQSLNGPVPLGFGISKTWSIIGPFQLGTRESPWSSDPLERYGGFNALEYDPDASFGSTQAFNGSLSWLNFTSENSFPSPSSVKAELIIDFLPSIDWPFLQDVFGWAGHQWLGWARGEIYIQGESTKTLAIHSRNIIEFWVDDVRYYGGDFYGFGRAAVTVHLTPGTHRIDVKIVGDVRAFGGIGDPVVRVAIKLQDASRELSLLYYDNDDVLVSDFEQGVGLVSPYATVAVRNDAQHDLYVHHFESMDNACELELIAKGPIKVVPGQTRPVGFRLMCTPEYGKRASLDIVYTIDGEDEDRRLRVTTSPNVIEDKHSLHKITYVHPSGVVSYAVLRPPSRNAACGCGTNVSAPVLVGLHGASTNADAYNVKHSLDPLPDLCAWFLIPQGTTPWSGDDWHSWGFADVEAAIAAIPDWIHRVNWKGPGVDVDKWLVSGHSNGGQGVWYALTHRPDKIIAAVALSGYSSIQNYVPYTSWRTADPGQTLLVQASMSTYRHDLLMENTKDIPIIIQHGSKDDNVPAYHSRLMSMRIEEIGGDSAYHEIPGENHIWKGLETTEPLCAFYEKHLDCNTTQKANTKSDLRNFSLVVANPGDTGSKNGVKIQQLMLSGQLGRVDFTYDPLTSTCIFRTSNIAEFQIPPSFSACDFLQIDREEFNAILLSSDYHDLVKEQNTWNIQDERTSLHANHRKRQGRQLGALDAIMLSYGTFKIVRHSAETAGIAVQVSRNLCQYYAADTEITDDYEEALAAEGNVISISLGEDMRSAFNDEDAIVVGNEVLIRDGENLYRYSEITDGLAAIFLRPLPGERLELVVWGRDRRSLEVASRLVPVMTGSGQPDWIVTDKRMMWRGLQGTLALGFFDSSWRVSKNSYFT